MTNFNQNNFNGMQRNNNFAPYYTPPASVVSTTSTNNIVQVQGIEGAKAWQLNPNSMVILLDSEAEGKMYIKVSDNIGMSTLRIFNYVEEVPINNTAPTNVTINNDLDLSQYVRKDELSALIKEIVNENEQSISTAATTESAPSAAKPATTTAAKPKSVVVTKQ